VRKHWILSCWLSATVFSFVGTVLSGAATAQGAGQSQALSAWQNGGVPAQQKVSWTQKFTGVFKGKSSNQAYGPQRIEPLKSSGSTALDPISLGFASGPPNADLYLSMAKMSDLGGNTPHARSMYQRALSIDHKNLEGMLALARLEDREGQLDAALHYYRQAVQTHPQSPKALNDLSLCFARRGQLNEALPPLEQAIRLQPTKPLYRNNIAKVLIELNQIDGAVQHQSAVHPPAVAQYNVGVLLHQRGRDAEAVSFLAGANQADPNFAAANALLAQLTSNAQQPIAQASGIQTPGIQTLGIQAPRATNDHVLPTPRTSPYPTTGAVSATPTAQAVPAETARVPVGYSPMSLPPVR